jgi:hypothetical protein
MKRMLTLLIFAAFITTIAGCTPAAPPEITGLIYSIADDKILVVEGIDTADIAYEEWFEKGNNAIFFTINRDTALQKNGKKISFEQLEAGQKVEVWSTGGLMKSYPMQGTAKKIAVLE